MNRSFENIDRDRRRFLGAAALTLAAAQLDALPAASAQSGTSDETLFRAFQLSRSRPAERPFTFYERASVARCYCCTAIPRRI
jgi:hypothetical protein